MSESSSVLIVSGPPLLGLNHGFFKITGVLTQYSSLKAREEARVQIGLLHSLFLLSRLLHVSIFKPPLILHQHRTPVLTRLSTYRNYLDRSNITNAYVSGMKEDLNFKGAQLTVINTIYSVGYLLYVVLVTFENPV